MEAFLLSNHRRSMEFFNWFVDLVLHLDDHLLELTTQYGTWVYAILFAIIFAETGLVVTPFLPGDSLLFAVGSLTALGALDLVTVLFLLTVAAVLGDTVNYWIGARVGPKVFTQKHSRFFKKEHLDRTHAFYEKYGGKTIVIARFVPIVRTFAPFVAGIGAMTYSKFVAFNVAGGILWVVGLVLAGYFFGNLSFVQNNFSLVILAIIIISILPGLVEYLRHRREQGTTPGEVAE
jgi:membrane-associated protein